MQDILTITLNPAVDLSTATDVVEPGTKLRCERPQMDPGGGGINVSRAVRNLGGQTRAIVAIGGPTGKKLRYLVQDEGIALLPLGGPGETRQSIAITDSGTGQQYRFVMPGPQWDELHIERMLNLIDTAVPDQGIVVLSGSNPPGVPVDFISRVCTRLASRKACVIADTSGAALQHLYTATTPPPRVLRMDHEEAEMLAGRALPERADSAEIAADMVRRGVAKVVIVARGADGSVMATEDHKWHAAAADVPVLSKVGAGDSFVGAFTLSVARNEPLEIALQRGSAAASAAVMTEATRLCTRADAENLTAECVLTRLG